MKEGLRFCCFLIGLVIAPATTAISPLQKLRGGGLRKSPSDVASPKRSFHWDPKSLRPLVTKSIERSHFSKRTEPETEGQAEWIGFLNGWMMVALPIPLPLLVAALALNGGVLLFSQWKEAIKNKYLIGLSHGALVLVVLLREWEAATSKLMFPRVVAMSINLATTLFFGHSGSNIRTKIVMNLAIYTTMLYILARYFS